MAAPSSIYRLEPIPPVAIELLNRIPARIADVLDWLEEQPSLRADILQIVLQSARPPGDGTPETPDLLQQTDPAQVAEIALTLLVRAYLRRALSLSEDHSYWRYSLACAVCCEQVALPRRVDGLLAYAAGLLHDMGRLALIAAYPNQYSNLLALTDRMFASNEPFDILEHERLLFGFDHFETGAWVAAAWKLPAWMRSMVGKFDERASGEYAALVETVRAGTRLAHSLGFGYLQAAPRTPVREILGRFPEAEKYWKVLDNWDYAEETLRGKVRARLRWYSAEE